jgi:hypothetical protein
MKRIILLDLNYTLAVTARGVTLPPLRTRLETETYRQWLVELVRPEYVVLVTARPDRWANATIERIHQLTGWRPQRSYFNTVSARPHVWKERVARSWLFPEFGTDGRRYLAIESNPQTRAVYARLGIPAHPIPETGEWESLPIA